MLLKAGANQYKIEYDMNAICEFEDITGMQVAYITHRSLSGLNSLRALFWAGLQKNHPGLTLKDAGNIMTEYFKSGKKIDSLYNLIFSELEKLEFFKKDENSNYTNQEKKRKKYYHSKNNV
jgi:hypothetical protein